MKLTAMLAAALLCLALPAQAADVKAGALTIENPWVRATMGKTAAAYLTIRNDGDADRLLAVQSPAAAQAQVHSMTMEGEVMKMRPVEALAVPAHGSVAIAPGGYHIMLMGLKAPLKAGDTVPLTLKFEHAGTVEVAAAVQKAGTMNGGAMMDHQHMMNMPAQ